MVFSQRSKVGIPPDYGVCMARGEFPAQARRVTLRRVSASYWRTSV